MEICSKQAASRNNHDTGHTKTRNNNADLNMSLPEVERLDSKDNGVQTIMSELPLDVMN